MSPVYPRVYGGTLMNLIDVICVSGLSPCVRGNQSHEDPELNRVRSIPVCTGEPSSYVLYSYHMPVYPRVYGGTLSGGFDRGADQGLSPCVRGNLPRLATPSHAQRSIPVCTGEPRA